jgi:hypothetical protein
MSLKSLKHAADSWGVSVYTARRLASVGLVRTVRVGRRRLVSEDEIARIALTGVPTPASQVKAGAKRPKARREV